MWQVKSLFYLFLLFWALINMYLSVILLSMIVIRKVLSISNILCCSVGLKPWRFGALFIENHRNNCCDCCIMSFNLLRVNYIYIILRLQNHNICTNINVKDSVNINFHCPFHQVLDLMILKKKLEFCQNFSWKPLKIKTSISKVIKSRFFCLPSSSQTFESRFVKQSFAKHSFVANNHFPLET